MECLAQQIAARLLTATNVEHRIPSLIAAGSSGVVLPVHQPIWMKRTIRAACLEPVDRRNQREVSDAEAVGLIRVAGKYVK